MTRDIVSTAWQVVTLLLGYFFSVSAITNELIPPTLPDGCACPGEILSYNCTVTGGAVIVWSGSAFICPSSANQVVLLSNQFETESLLTLACGPFEISRLSVENSTGVPCYSSVMLVNTTITRMNGQTVRCSRDGVTIGSHTLSVAGAAPVSLSPSAIGQSTFTIGWTPTVSCASVNSYRVNADTGNCGSCSHNVGTNTAICSGWTPSGQTCSVRVVSEVCDGSTGDPSENLDFLLQEPNPPSVSIQPCYYQSTSTLSILSISFPTVATIQVAPGLSPDVTYSVRFNNDAQLFPTSNCSRGVCSGTFTNPPTEDFNIAVIASNGLGSGQASPSVRVLSNINSLVSLSVRAAENTAIFTLNLLQGFVGTTDMRVEYRAGDNVLNATSNSSAGAGGVLTLTLTSLLSSNSYTYSVFFIHNGVELKLQGMFSSQCQPEDLGSTFSSTNPECTTGDFVGGVRIANGDVCYTGTTPGGGFFALALCDSGYQLQAISSQRRNCLDDGTWSGSTAECIQQGIIVPLWIIPVIVLGIVFFFVVGVIVGIFCVVKHVCDKIVNGLHNGNCCFIFLVVILTFLFGFGIGIFIGYCCVRNKKGSNQKSGSSNVDKRELTKGSSPPPDSFYADPNKIEHQTTTTGEEYAMVDVKNRKGKTPTQAGALYQDPNAIDHQAAPSGEMYAVVDKPKRGSSKKREPDVVPPGNAGLTYADIDVSTNRNKPRARQQQAQHPGHVEYADIHPGSEHARL